MNAFMMIFGFGLLGWILPDLALAVAGTVELPIATNILSCIALATIAGAFVL